MTGVIPLVETCRYRGSMAFLPGAEGVMKDHRPARLLDAAVGDVAAADLRACELFDRVGLRFAEDGALGIAEACRIHHVDESIVERALAGRDGRAESTAHDAPLLDETCRRVVRCHHGPLRASLGSLRTRLSTMCGEVDRVGPAVQDTRCRLEALAESVLMHFAKEENILFPAFAALAAARQQDARRPPLPFATVMYPIRAMEVEHARLESELHALVAVAASGEPGMGLEAGQWQEFRSQLETFARELAAHAHFENAVLFARALDIERALY
jgi:regulator of cell morphogenesis and NO signaling